jgi:hypothetical protein
MLWPARLYLITITANTKPYEAFHCCFFWECYDKLPADIKEKADKNYLLLRENPGHPSLHFKKIGNCFSARVSLRYRT